MNSSQTGTTRPKKLGFLSFGHYRPVPGSPVPDAATSLRNHVEIATMELLTSILAAVEAQNTRIATLTEQQKKLAGF